VPGSRFSAAVLVRGRGGGGGGGVVDGGGVVVAGVDEVDV